MQVVIPKKFGPITGFRCGGSYWGKPRMYVYCFLVDGVLIDTGPMLARNKIIQTLENYSFQQLFITHHHEDHCGNCHALEEHFSVPAYAHERCAEKMKNLSGISFAQHITWGRAREHHHLIPLTRYLETDQYRFQIIPTPGHAIDHICLYEPNQGWLFSGDLYVYDYIKFFLREESMAQQIDSIKKILQLDFEWLLCSHNPQLKNGKEKLKKKLAFLEDFYGKVVYFHKKGFPPTVILQKMGLTPQYWMRIISHGRLSTLNMVRAIIRDENTRMMP